MKPKQFIPIVIFIMLIVVQLNSFAQQDSISEPVKDYWQIMNRYSLRYNGKDDFIKSYSGNEIDTLTKKYYKAICENPVGFKVRIENEYNKYDSLARSKHGLPYGFIPQVGLMKEVISSKYGKNFTEIISVPYYLRVKIVGDSGSIYEGPINSKIKNNPHNIFRTSQGNLFAVIEDVIKGNKFFKIGQKITISYLTFWIAKGGKFFEKGKTYFIPLKPWDSFHAYSKLTIDILPDKDYAIYPIENDIISTPNNYFGIGKTTYWKVFKKAFQGKYILN